MLLVMAETEARRRAMEAQMQVVANERAIRMRPTVEPPVQKDCCICSERAVLVRSIVVSDGSENKTAKNPCSHEFCLGCLTSWIRARVVDDGTAHILCPEAECKRQLFGDDVRRISAELYPKFLRLVASDYTARAAEAEADPETAGLLQAGKLRKCPHCNVLLERSHGCSSMLCRCGKTFCFGCGKAACVCHTMSERRQQAARMRVARMRGNHDRDSRARMLNLPADHYTCAACAWQGTGYRCAGCQAPRYSLREINRLTREARRAAQSANAPEAPTIAPAFVPEPVVFEEPAAVAALDLFGEPAAVAAIDLFEEPAAVAWGPFL